MSGIPRSISPSFPKVSAPARAALTPSCAHAVFDAANSPEIQFRSTSVTRTSDTTALVTGRLTARGKSFPEKFTAELSGLKGSIIKFHVTGKVLRSRYGMDVGTPIYSNIVDFDMTLTGKRS